MGNKMLEDIIKPNDASDLKLRVVIASELELATKLSNKEILNNLGGIIKNYEGKIDGIVINGGLAYIPDKYSRLRGERLDLVEDRLKEKYGEEVYNEVKRGKTDSDSIDDLTEAARLARIQMKTLVYEARKKNIPIYYIYGVTDYKNVKMIIEALERLSRRNNKEEEKAKTNKKNKKQNKLEDKMPDEIERIMSIIPESYKFKASKWKTSDKKGIKDKANDIYLHLIGMVLNNGKSGDNIKVYKRFENFIGEHEDNNPDAEILINGLKVKVFHAINALTAGLNEGKPSDRNINMIVDYANLDAQYGRLADIYITGRGSTTELTALDYQSRKAPVLILNQGPLLDIDRQFRLRASLNKTDVSKRLSQFEDSGISFLSVYKDNSVEMEHIDITGIKKGIDPYKIDKDKANGSLYEIVQISDWHVGNAASDYEAMEKVPNIVNKSQVPKDKRVLFVGGDMVDGGNDKAQRTKMSLPRSPSPEEFLRKLEDILDDSDKDRAKTNFVSELHKMVYGNSDIDLGQQEKRLDEYLRPLGPLFEKAYVVGGNHFERATGNGSEGRMIGPKFENNGTKEVIYVDDYLLRGETPYLDKYGLLQMHSAGYRGGADARTSLMNTVKNTGKDLVDIAMAGDCHEAGIKFALKKKDEEWRTMAAITVPALENETYFESYIIHKPNYTKGISELYVPTDTTIGTSYLKYRLIPLQTIRNEIRTEGGSRYDRLLDSLLKKFN
jgi:predicted HTH domain antitoxin